jgi:hypothetical protein
LFSIWSVPKARDRFVRVAIGMAREFSTGFEELGRSLRNNNNNNELQNPHAHQSSLGILVWRFQKTRITAWQREDHLYQPVCRSPPCDSRFSEKGTWVFAQDLLSNRFISVFFTTDLAGKTVPFMVI